MSENIIHQQTFSSLLQYICKQQVDELILEERLKLLGYKFSYIIDPYDLINYCFPFGIVEENRDKDPFRLSMTDNDKLDEFVAYDIFFQKKDSIFFILDEHLDEFYDFQVTIKNQAQIGLSVVDTNDRLIRMFKERKSIYETIDLINSIEVSNLSLILSIAIGYLRNGIQKLEKIIKEEKRLITDISVESDNSRVIELVEIVSNIRPSDLTKSISKESYSIAKAMSKTDYELFNRQINLRNDSDVIDRVLSINRKLISLNNKELCLFLSSTSNSFQWMQLPREEQKLISEKICHIHKLIKEEFPSINNELLNPHRSSAQIFLSLLLDEEDKESKIKYLEQFRDSVAINFTHDFSRPKIRGLDNFWMNRIDLLREKSENLALLSQFKKYKNTLIKAKQLKELNSFKLLNNIFSIIISKEEYLQNISNLRDQNFRLYYYESSFQASFIKGLNNLNQLFTDIGAQEKNVFSLIKTGQDRIGGRYQILPVVFKISRIDLNEIIAKYVDFIFTNDSTRVNNRYLHNFFISWLNRTAEILKQNNFEDKQIELIRCLILLLLPKINNQGRIVLNRINEIIRWEISENQKDLLQEFYYVATWTARRIVDYKSAENFSRKGIKNDPNDPRFHHSMALICYCKHFELEENSKFKMLSDSILHSNRAITHYKNLGDETVVKKSIMALYNTIIYCKCLLWYYQLPTKINNSEILQLGTIFDQEIKEKEDDYDKKIEFIHTKAFIEYLESLYYKNKGEQNMAFNKISTALNSINTALIFNKTDKQSLKLQLEILEEMQKIDKKENEHLA